MLKVYEYAKNRGVPSRLIVKTLQKMGVTTVKNHLSLVPLKVLAELDQIDFTVAEKPKRHKCVIILSLQQDDYLKKRLRYYQQKKMKVILLQPCGNLPEVGEVEEWNIPFAGRRENVKVYYEVLDGCACYQVAHDLFSTSKRNLYQDEVETYALYCQVVQSFLNLKQPPVDYFEIHYWQLGILPAVLKKSYHGKIIFHPVYFSFQGLYGEEVLPLFGLQPSDELIYAGSINFLKVALLCSDEVKYTKEVLEEFKSSYLQAFVYDA